MIYFRYTMIAFHCFFGGFLPFSAISVELYYIFATVWGREQYTLYGVLLLVFFIVLLVSACISVALTYFQVRYQIDLYCWTVIIFSVVFRRLSLVVAKYFFGWINWSLCVFLFLFLLSQAFEYVWFC